MNYMNNPCEKCKRKRSCNTFDRTRGMPCKDYMRTTKDSDTKKIKDGEIKRRENT